MGSSEDIFAKGLLLDGRFRTVAPLNHGSFGMVFLAKDIKTGQDVAVKCMAKTPSNVNSDSSLVDDRFEELESHRHLKYHPNIVNLIHSFETDTHIYLVLEYCANGDLYEAIRLERGPLETGHVRDFMLQLISATEFMHASGLYHRDIKPENIFLTQDGEMKLGDFGLVTRDAWCYEACVGSDRYMAPEQYDPAGTGYSPAKADVWAVGICLLNVLFGRNPFVTPTVSDVLFADYARDRQSLFDVFPNMSQDTYEILTHALALDPEKRSLSGVRDAIMRAVCFTTDAESLDEFCTEDREVIPASANREPLRTPSVQSPNVNQGDCFPWAKALQSTIPQDPRQLSAIPDTEDLAEDLFPSSEYAGTSWFSRQPDTPSVASVLESNLGESFKSSVLASCQPSYPPPSDPVPITGSLPGNAFKRLPSLSMVFGKNKNDQISKSWSDLWDEEEEEFEHEDLALQQRREQNARSWSHDSQHVDLPGSRKGLNEPKTTSFINERFEPRDVPSPSTGGSSPKPIRTTKGDASPRKPRRFAHSPPKKSSLDKWAALGDKRRNYKSSEKLFSSFNAASRRDWGLGSSGFDYGSWIKKTTPPASYADRPHRSFLDENWRRDSLESRPAPANPSNNGYDGSVDEDLDLVGGWHDLHL